MGSKSKCGKVSRNRKIDRISSLPDAVVSQILSFLPTKYAVRTSILSKRWKYLWTSITNLDFEENSGLASVSFVNFVDRVLRLCDSAQIQKFRLIFNRKINPCPVSGWIDEAIRRNVHELDLDCYTFKLPLRVFTYKTLTVLKLRTGYIGEPDNPVCLRLPSLKILHIDVNNPPPQKLFCSCAVLEEMIIKGYLKVIFVRDLWDENELIFDVYAPALKRLTMNEFITEESYKFAVNAPNLEYLEIFVECLGRYTMENLPSLVEAVVNIDYCCIGTEEFANRAFELLRGISSVKSLTLDCNIMSALYDAYDNNLPTFHNLTRLEVGIPFCYGWRLLPGLLESSPNLEVLILKKDGDGFAMLVKDYDWSEPQSVPNCLLLHLEVIKMKIFEGKEYELKVVQNLLGCAQVLKKLTVNCRGLALKEELKFCRRLLEFPRASRSCQIQILGRSL